jgi:hypothetical protein
MLKANPPINIGKPRAFPMKNRKPPTSIAAAGPVPALEGNPISINFFK